ncbi:hypothetical protein DVH24_001461 [Malus domestica]|uniref:Uncharacterized protein n=1 Tax=Malus domestica TaxID=3750 RepID=A0A498K1G1_MALDO|nr:hypothetical protein DVH24_001461 [Malus domestica]
MGCEAGTWSTCASTRGIMLCCSPLRQPRQFLTTQLSTWRRVGEPEILLRFLDVLNPNPPFVFSNLNFEVKCISRTSKAQGHEWPPYLGLV